MNYMRVFKLLGGCLLPISCVLAVSYHLEMKARKASQPQLAVRIDEATALTNVDSLDRLEIDLYVDDLRQIRKKVRQLSWVRDASVRRIWPDQLYLYVKSRRPLAFWDEGYVLSQDGTLVEKSAMSADLALPVVRAPRSYRKKAARDLMRITEALDKAGVALSEFHMEEWGEISLVSASGQKIMLGSAQLNERLARLQQLMAAGDASIRNAQQIDLRYLSAVAVRGVN